MKNLIFDAPGGDTFNIGASQTFLSRDRGRKFVEIINTHATAKAYLAFGDNVAELGKGTVLMPNGGCVTFTEEYMKSMQQINLIVDTDGTTLCWTIGR